MEALSPAPDRPYLGVHAITVFVHDQETARRFYTEILGFEVAFDARLPTGRRWLAVAPPDGSAVISLVAPDPESREYALIGRPTGVVLITENVLAKFEEWRRRGVQFTYRPRLRRFSYENPPRVTPEAANASTAPQEQPVWGGIFARFRDLDGNVFSLVGFDELNRQFELQRRAYAEKVEAQRRAAHELEIAKQVQARLFPQQLPPLATLDYAGACIQARQVGGDYHDFLDLGPGRLGLIIADISGKGMPAALLMANLQANVRSQSALAINEPERMLRSVNQLFQQNTGESSYATLFYADYDDRSRRLRYANCGHLAPLVLHRDGTVDRLESTCTVVGMFQTWDCAIRETHICPGDTLVLYTDGVTESFNSADEEFGECRLIDTLRCHQSDAPSCAIASVVDALRQFSPAEQFDDITLILARST
jgi:serine phosphatase RsbU (regulator of sigma subunit)/catechol 2,3-dioxygenase-like lactoylglutathione lyase family enzyme